ncbi:MAG: YfhO family protein [Anaerolineales bacterium]|nr:YfhO family protein [Anaerolineales bacterium]
MGQPSDGQAAVNTLRSGAAGRSPRESLAVVLLLLLSLALFFWPAVLGGRVLLPADLIFEVDPLWRPLAPDGWTQSANQLLSDQVYLYYPWSVLARRSLAQGQIPLWNPYAGAGLPFVGNAQSALFSPFTLVAYLLPLHASYVITAILRLLVAGVFTYLFAREIGIARRGALLAMVAFTFSGPMIVWLGYPLSPVIVWLPALLFCTERALSRRSTLYTLLTGVVVGAQFCGGHPQTSFHVILVWAAYGLVRVIGVDGRRINRLAAGMLRLAGAALLGVALAAVQLLPFLEALADSSILAARQMARPSGAAALAGRLVADWQQWPTAITALLPDYLGTPLDKSYLYPYSNYVEQNVYAGVLPLVLALTYLIGWTRSRADRRSRAGCFFGILAVLSIGIALRLPLLTAANHLPLFSIVNNGRLRLVYVFALSLLAGMGLDSLLDHHSQQRVLSTVLVALAALNVLAVVLALGGFVALKEPIIEFGRDYVEQQWGTPYYARPIENYYAEVEARYEKRLHSFLPTNVTMFLPALIAFVYAGFTRCLGPRLPAGRLRAAMVIGLTMADLFLVGMRFNPSTAPGGVVPVPDAVSFLRQDSALFRVVGTGLTLYPNSGMMLGLQDVRGYDAILPQRYVALIDRIQGHYRHGLNSLFVEVDAPLLDMLNVKYALTDQELGDKWELVYEGQGAVNVYRNSDVLPRATVVHQAEIVPDAAASLARVTDPSFDFRHAVVLEEAPEDWKPPSAASTGAYAHVTEYQPNQLTVEVDTPEQGVLVIVDTYAPGWRAELDGQPTRLYIANHAFRAVMVPPGAHEVQLRYWPASFAVGMWISLAAGAFAVGAALLLVVRNRRTAR